VSRSRRAASACLRVGVGPLFFRAVLGDAAASELTGSVDSGSGASVPLRRNSATDAFLVLQTTLRTC
jgi:hypothetical protein